MLYVGEIYYHPLYIVARLSIIQMAVFLILVYHYCSGLVVLQYLHKINDKCHCKDVLVESISLHFRFSFSI